MLSTRIKYILAGVSALLVGYLLTMAGYYLYVYFIVFSPQQLMKDPVRWCPASGCLKNEAVAIPRILHHTWRDKDVPEQWRATYQSCLDKHKDWKHMFWTDADIQKFLEKEYPWFMPTYHSYKYPIQRVDAMRYFLLYHFGGVYIDLDVGCYTSADDTLKGTYNYSVVFLEAVPTGITNWFMASVPRHPLFGVAIEMLPRANRWYGLPHATIMFSAGPMLLTRAASANPNKQDVLIISLQQVYNRHFWRVQGGSWHQRDEVMFKVIDDFLRKIGNKMLRVLLLVLAFVPVLVGGIYKFGNIRQQHKLAMCLPDYISSLKIVPNKYL